MLQAGDVALVLGAAGLHVLRRGTDGTWRAAISLLDLEPTTGGPYEPGHAALAPVSTPAGDGEARWWLGALAEIKVTAEQTGGLLSIVEITEPPDAEAPLHVHHREDEAFWILEGDVTLEVGDAAIEAQRRRLCLRPARRPAPLHRRPRRLPDALHHDPRRLRGPRARDERAGRRAHPAAAARRRARLGARRRRGEANGCELLA